MLVRRTDRRSKTTTTSTITLRLLINAFRLITSAMALDIADIISVKRKVKSKYTLSSVIAHSRKINSNSRQTATSDTDINSRPLLKKTDCQYLLDGLVYLCRLKMENLPSFHLLKS